MVIRDLINTEKFQLVTGKDLDQEITGGYIGDLLSWVMAHLDHGQCWITIQSHLNVIAVASLNEASCIILAEGAKLDTDAKEKAEEEELAVLETDLSAFNIAILIHELMNKNG